MKQKILLFNYFVKKVADKEKEMYQLSNEQAALLAVIFSRASVEFRHATGCSLEAVYMADPKIAEELFILLCVDAEKHGDHLMEQFNFEKVPVYEYGNPHKDLSDKEIAAYLNDTLYPVCKEEVNKDVYKALIFSREPLDDILRRIAPRYLRSVGVSELELPAPCAETAMIDRAWERLLGYDGFKNLVSLAGKHDKLCHSLIYKRYAEENPHLLAE